MSLEERTASAAPSSTSGRRTTRGSSWSRVSCIGSPSRLLRVERAAFTPPSVTISLHEGLKWEVFAKSEAGVEFG